MEKYLQLCVELRKSHIAKEGLYQYKNICQQVKLNILVLRYLWTVLSLQGKIKIKVFNTFKTSDLSWKENPERGVLLKPLHFDILMKYFVDLCVNVLPIMFRSSKLGFFL